MMDEYFATGFTGVDLQNDVGAYKKCLFFIDSLPYYQELKQSSYKLLELAPGMSVLDVGSGTGDDVIRMAAKVMRSGIAVGIDSSINMIKEACSRTPKQLNVKFLKADARELPFSNDSFNRCRIDRTLQHIQGPEKVIYEAVRVLQAEGLLLVYDNDWRTFSINGTDEKTTRIVEKFWYYSFTNSRVGRYLKEYFAAAGLEEIHVYPSVSVINDFITANRIYNIRQSAERAVEKGLISENLAEQWLLDLEKLSDKGMFRCVLNAYTVTGRKPR